MFETLKVEFRVDFTVRFTFVRGPSFISLWKLGWVSNEGSLLDVGVGPSHSSLWVRKVRREVPSLYLRLGPFLSFDKSRESTRPFP